VDRSAKLTAIRERITLAEKLRTVVVLAHDQQSFQGLVSIIQGLVARSPIRAGAGDLLSTN
jgi:hypothetical protein